VTSQIAAAGCSRQSSIVIDAYIHANSSATSRDEQNGDACKPSPFASGTEVAGNRSVRQGSNIVAIFLLALVWDIHVWDLSPLRV
jgi:hypothetical protein